MSRRIGAALRRAVADRALHRCEYCGMPDAESVVPHEPDHVVAFQHGCKTTSENLAHACFDCNRTKGSNISSLDPDTDLLTALYNPQMQLWADHFRWNGASNEPLTAVGRTTVYFLRLNDPLQVKIRGNLLRQGRY